MIHSGASYRVSLHQVIGAVGQPLALYLRAVIQGARQGEPVAASGRCVVGPVVDGEPHGTVDSLAAPTDVASRVVGLLCGEGAISYGGAKPVLGQQRLRDEDLAGWPLGAIEESLYGERYQDPGCGEQERGN
ncbi:hypothetical protein ACFUTV_43010 [Streptomyces sp. NPDC057298]|uniref:hypothetical protein n=1 Tax=Streptomyces sp. NPDC057298 TaxID=3346091 RepID=UPI00362CA7B2